MNSTERRQKVFEFFTNKNFEINENFVYRPRDSDIIVVGPPKSGTTWVQQILHQIRSKGDDSFQDIYAVTCYLPRFPVLNYDCNAEQVCYPRIYKHHESFGNVPTTKNQKKIFIVRDPYDAAYSLLKFFGRFYGGDSDLTDREMSELLMSLHELDQIPSFLSIATWWAHRSDPNILFIFYDDLIKDLKSMIKKIADFVEIHLRDVELKNVRYFCTFAYMSQNKEKFQGEPLLFAIAQSAGILPWKSGMGLVRNDGGKIGEGHKIGPELNETVRRLWSETMEQQFGFKNYKEMYEKYGLFAGL